MRIDLKRLEMNLSDRPVLRGITAHVASGASVAIVGVSGSGKTTLLRCVAGLTKPSAGSVSIDGQPPQSYYGHGVLSYLFQEPYLWSHLTVQQCLELTFKLHQREADTDQIDDLLDRVGLTTARNLFPYQLSVGMKARAAIGRAFCVNPRVLLMDEPFAAIDPIRRLDLNQQVQRLRQDYGCTTLWASHDVVEALQFATNIIAIAPPPIGTATILDLHEMPLIKDNASLSNEALVARDRILRIITGQVASEKEYDLETV